MNDKRECTFFRPAGEIYVFVLIIKFLWIQKTYFFNFTYFNFKQKHLTRMKNSLLYAAILGGAAVVLGAFGAHALRETLAPERLQAYHTGVEYQFYHALALLAVGLLSGNASGAARPWLRRSALCLVGGTLCFSGSIYLLALRDFYPEGLRAVLLPVLGPITPIGGLLLIGGWLCLAVGVSKNSSN